MATPKEFSTALDTYQLGALIAEGASSYVFEVKSTDGADWALKLLKPELVTQRSARFKNETLFIQQNTHNNIIKAVDVGISIINTVDCPFYVMRFYPSTLRGLMNQRIGAKQAIELFDQLLSGIQVVHSAGVVHGDLTPSNILYDPSRLENSGPTAW